LNTICENFIGLKSDTTSSIASGILGNEESSMMMGMDSLSKKRWIEQRMLMSEGFIEGAPKSVKGFLTALRDNQADYITPLTKLRN
jgi:hypothetical protein